MASCHTRWLADTISIHPRRGIKRLRKNILELVLSEYPPERLTPEPGMLPTEFQAVVAAAATPKSATGER
jgi:formate dehydrogenase major subunit